jgi:hypothetical protein
MPSGSQIIDRVCEQAKLNKGVVTAPVTYGVHEDNSTTTFTAETTDMNDVGTNDVTLPDPFDTSDAMYVGYTSTFDGLRINVNTAAAGDAVVAESVWEYYNGALWVSLQAVVDGTAGFQNSGVRTVTWQVPSDWSTVAVNSQTNYYVRFRALADDIWNTTQPTLTSVSIRQRNAERVMVEGFVQEAVDRLAFDAEINHDPTVSVALTAGTSIYNLTSTPFAITDLIAIDNVVVSNSAVTSYPLERVTWEELLYRQQGAGQANGTPQVYAVNYPSIGFHPTPDTNCTLNIPYVADGATIVDNSTALTLVPKALQWGCLFTLAMHYALSFKGDVDGAERWLTRYLTDRHVGLPAARRWSSRVGGMPPSVGATDLVLEPSQDSMRW